jgi:hypothetical protein
MKKQVVYLQKLFYDLWNDFGSVYLLVGYSERTRIGKQGFTDEEKEKGLILVFNDKTSTRIDWDEEGDLSCVLAFGARKEDVWIHYDDLFGVFSPEAGVQFLRTDIGKEDGSEPAEETGAGGVEAGKGEPGHVISLSDFRKKRPNGHQ